MAEVRKNVIVCSFCWKVNKKPGKNCRKCRSPLAEVALPAAGRTKDEKSLFFEKNEFGPPRFIVLLGTWIFCFPWVIGLIGLEVFFILNWDGLPSFFFFVGCIALFLVFVKMLYSVTRNYLEARF